MVTIAQRIEALRTARGMSRPALSAALGFPRMAVEKFETGRQTPTQDQQVKLAAYFGVSLEDLRGEASVGDWMMDGDIFQTPEPKPAPAAPKRPAPVAQSGSGGEGTMFDAFLTSKKFQESLRTAVLDAMRSPEGQEILTKIVRKELSARK